ncbi:MAG: glucoamylase family protein [Deltaproteobacteria bacterium]|nr:glucoamylase family protein [Deltaproteobacteria bacterium]
MKQADDDGDDAPRRAELFSVSQLEQHARKLAGWHELSTSKQRRKREPDRLLPRLSMNERMFERAYGLITDAVAEGRRITPAAEWFIDNYPLIEEQIRTARRHLPRGYSRELPQLSNPTLAGTPRVYDLALELISHSHGRIDERSLQAFVAAYQSKTPLRLGELWAIPIMLRLALLENLRHIVASVTAGRRDREHARSWVKRMIEMAAGRPEDVVVVLAEMVRESPPLTDAFVSELASRLQAQGASLSIAASWLDHRLAERGQNAAQVFQLASQNQAADQVAIGNSIGGLRFLSATDWQAFVEGVSVVDETLRADPAGVYRQMDFETRDRYRHAVEALARRSVLDENAVAAAAIALASTAQHAGSPPVQAHVGYWLVDDGREALEVAAKADLGIAGVVRGFARRHALLLYVGGIVALTVVATLGLAQAWQADIGKVAVVVVPLLLLTTSQLAISLVQWLVTSRVPPRLLSRLDFSKGIPAGQRALVAVPALCTDLDEVDALVDALELRFLANRDPLLSYALLTDLKDCALAGHADDDALVARAMRAIAGLNARYAVDGGSGPFLLLHRARRFNPQEGVWMGWERKRGKLEDLNATLRGARDRFDVVVGDLEGLAGVRYVIALDSDTQLPRDAARLLVATMAHPLNRPVYDDVVGRVTRGYSILQPRVGVTMASAARTRFARLFAGEPGIDPYTRAVSDVYQDLFDEGSFVGKGIYDVDSLRQAIGGRFPENRVLSHDLLEGAYARCGLVSDVLLVEEQVPSHRVDMSRRGRWIRGDWQIASWLLPRVPVGAGARPGNSLSALSRWKIFDNLRRSIVAPALLALLVLGWSEAISPALATAAVLLVLALPGIVASATAVARRPVDISLRRYAPEVGRELGRQLLRDVLAIAWLPADAALSLGAIARAAVRLLFTRRGLLEWRTASDAARAARGHLVGAFRSLWPAPTTALLVAAWLLARHPSALIAALPILLLWALAPALAWWLSEPLSSPVPRLDDDDVQFLEKLARRTWRFFAVFAADVDHHLAPDNFQEHPPQGIAHRTSPTNIGMGLLANLAAYDFGYVGVVDVVDRTTRTLATLDRLERYRGHFLNWYDTRSLEPLRPLYVSTVDSGNLAGHMLTLAAGLDALGDDPIVPPRLFAGLRTTLDLYLDACGGRDTDTARVAARLEAARVLLSTTPTSLSSTLAVLDQVAELAGDLPRGLFQSDYDHDDVSDGDVIDDEREIWALALDAQARTAGDDLRFTAPWVVTKATSDDDDDDLDRLVSLRAIAARVDGHPLKDPALRVALDVAAGRARSRLVALHELAVRCRAFSEVDVGFLYDPARRLLSIGFNVGDARLDHSFYDLLASEARLASYVAIAQGRLAQDHWFSLGRSLTTSGGRPALLSWSGSMFEYLMPLLVMPTYERTLLDETCRGVVQRHIDYGRANDLPWGVSESGYLKTDGQQNYQYRAFGVPGLGFKRGLADDLVVAPYASAMALMIDPVAACANLRRLERDGHLGAFGFYEAIDYTTARMPPGKSSATVRSFMAHHQGMTFLSLDWLLLNQPMQKRFLAEPSLRATELLLQERVPKTMPIYPHPAEVSASPLPGAAASFRVLTTPATPRPEVHLLSNGAYHVAVTNAGGGYSRWRDLAVTRWREDPTRDCWGTFLYLRDVDTGVFWSAAHQPTLQRATRSEAVFSQGRAELRRFDGDIETHVEIAVSPEDDVELRRVNITNRGRTARTLEVTSYAEVVLAPAAADAAHPAFSNLFVQTELLRSQQAILCTRRPRSAKETPPTLLHLMSVHGATAAPASFETAREAFIGRGRSAIDPIALHQASLGNSEGSVLDPIVAVRNVVVVEPQQTVRLHIATGVSETRERALAQVEKYRDPPMAERVLELSWTHSQVLLRRLDITEADVQLYERLASNVLYGNPALRAPEAVLLKNLRAQSGLWGYGISGDLPIVLVRIGDIAHIILVQHLLKAHGYWRLKGLAVDLVIWNEDPSGYRQVLHEQIMSLVHVVDGGQIDKPGGVFVRRAEQMSEEDKVLMQAVARVIVTDTAGPLAEQMERVPSTSMPPGLFPLRDRRSEPTSQRAPLVIVPHPPGGLAAHNGIGGFTRDGREYVITTTSTTRTPAPWVNVIANPWFGTVVSESGSAYTWCENAHANRLTPWNNDPVSDGSGEAVYIRDDDDGSFWSPTPLPAPDAAAYTTRHGFGYSVFEHATPDQIVSTLQTFVATDAPVKFVVLKLKNNSGRRRRLSITAVYELVLGALRSVNSPHVVTSTELRSGALMANNAYNSEFAQRVAFLDASEASRSVSGDRTEVLGRNGNPARPACLARMRLSGRVGAGLDPCLAMQVDVELADGQEREVVFTFGSGRDRDDAAHLIGRFRGVGAAHTALSQVWNYWNATLGALHVQTPDDSVNFLANGWLIYQVLAARMWARSGFYQSGGAFGFRDQLQDAMSLVHAEPVLLREQILRCASRQFVDGDVQHWWHPPSGRGVRTRISDDYLWLPYATSRYVDTLGDVGVLDEVAPFLNGRLVKHDEESYYDLPGVASTSGSLYEHCVRAIRHGLRFGVHGLPLMGCGDWNDGMNLVGDHGRGESVWLGFFLADVLHRFEPLARKRGDEAFADLCAVEGKTLRANLEEHAWDGGWYKRAWFDDGAPLGSSTSPECQIDALPQSWSVLSGMTDPARSKLAMAAVDARLVKPELGVIQLFDPPFNGGGPEPGYVRGYVPGVRENGGQYTHAAVWTVMAFAAAGDVERAWELFALINPVHHGDTREAIERYKVEPYVVAADVYTNPQHAGRGGWTWYTGSAGWMYRLVTESLLGVHLEVDRLRVSPKLPAAWPSIDIHYRHHSTLHHVHVRNGGGAPIVRKVVSDGVDQPSLTIPLHSDRQEHWSEVVVGDG